MHAYNERGPIAWMAKNTVAANLIMVVFILGGIFMAAQVKQEVFPEYELDIVSIQVPYPGASPEEVEQGILLAIEEGVRSLDGIKKVTATATEGMGTVTVELITGTNGNKALQDIKNEVDRITSFPQDAERPIVSLLTNRREVISLVIYGDLEEDILRNLAERVRDELLQYPEITMVELAGVRPLEIEIEVPQRNLRQYNLTLPQVSTEVRKAALEIPAGGVKTEGGEMLLRTAERRDYGSEFANIPIISQEDGTQILLEDIAKITDGFRDTDQAALFEGKPAIRVIVYRVGDQTPTEVTERAKSYVEYLNDNLPEGVEVASWYDSSEVLRDRIDLLLRNGLLGLALVLFILGIFLEIRLAFWVTVGLPVSVLGTFLFLPGVDVSINMISVFAFIVTLGIVVDDAIVAGENIYEMRQKGLPILQASIEGARTVAVPITFSVLTNIVAFTPLLFVPGIMGKFFRVIPLTVIFVLAISLIESLFILPAHITHVGPAKKKGLRGFIHRRQQWFAQTLNRFVHKVFSPLLHGVLHKRYLTLSCGISILLMMIGYIVGGHMNFTFMPKVDHEVVMADAMLPYGAPVENTFKVQEHMVNKAREVIQENGGERIKRGILTLIGNSSSRGRARAKDSSSGSHLTSVQIYLIASDKRPITSTEFAQQWRDKIGSLPGLESLTFDYSTGPGAGAAIDVELSHPEIDTLESAAGELALALENYTGVSDIDDGFTEGKPQLDLTVRPEARSLGLTAADLSQQVRGAYYGDRAFRQQRGREEIWIMVRLPEKERTSEYDVQRLLLRTPKGGEIPLMEAANVERGRAYTEIKRRDGRRVVNVTADVVQGVANAGKVLEDLQQSALPELMEKYPGLRYSLEGEQREQAEAMESLSKGFLFILLVIFAMLAIPFGSYIQPLAVLMSIPFGIVGAVLGHIIMGYDLSLISMMGIVALTGVVVNDSLMLIYTANEMRRDNLSPFQAIHAAGLRRFRPILLTSLTTFFGLAPMIFETSVQARFLIPMAISLGYGVLFITVIVLVITPALYMIIEDIKHFFGFQEKHHETN